MGLLTAKPSPTTIDEKDPWFLDIVERPDWKTVFDRDQPLKLEIGFGMGEFLIEMAAREPQSNFIGIDFYHKGIGKLLARIRNRGLSNIRLVHGDVRKKMPTLFEDGELDTVYINFPDPWPRKRHRKRRLIQPDFLRRLALKLAPGGRVCLSTDSQPYAREMLEYFNSNSKFQNRHPQAGFLEDRDGLPKSKFEKSFLYASDPVYYLEYTRRAATGQTESDYEKDPEVHEDESAFETQDEFLTYKFKNAEARASDACDLKRVADQLVDAGDPDWARKVYLKAEECAEDCLDFNWLGSSLCEKLGDLEWARRVYTKAEESAETSLDLNWLAYSVDENLKDREWAVKLFEQAENQPQSVRELCDLADSLGGQLGDMEWAQKVFRKAEAQAEDHSEFLELADTICINLGDKDWARNLYEKAEDKTEDFSDLLSLVESVFEKLGDPNWARQLFNKTEKRARTTEDCCNLAETLCKHPGDKKWARRVYKQAESLARNSADYDLLKASMEEYLGE